MSFVYEIEKCLLTARGVRGEEFAGCTEAQISQVMERQGVKSLPTFYREFLTRMGISASHLFVGADAFYPQLLYLKETATLLLEDCSSTFSMPTDAFVFLMQQGYYFMYFQTSDAFDDPPIFSYLEGDDQPTKSYESWSSLVRHEIENILADLDKGYGDHSPKTTD